MFFLLKRVDLICMQRRSKIIRKKSKNLLFSCILVLCILLLTQCSYNTLPEETPKEVVHKYASAMTEYDLTVMQECLDSKARRTNSAPAGLMGDIFGGLTGFNFDMGNVMDLAGPLFQFSKAMWQPGPFDSIKLIKIESEEIDEDQSTAEVITLYELDLSAFNSEYGGSDFSQEKISYRVKYFLTVEDNEWKIYKEDNLDKEKIFEVFQCYFFN
jgi:hypothetical protein